ncbi:MAG: type II toxin-antitoxin system VapC family toxin [Chloroflexi bacterium]|nr:type II toxin-antitoxin system VapC family toxin [Chloroflexota bacterium]
MSISGKDSRADVLVDTSVAIALVLADHEGHASTMAAVEEKRLGLSGHAWYETYSVLTRLPPRVRRSPSDVLRLLDHDFPGTRFLDRRAASGLRHDLARLGIAGGAVYDALVGAAARHHGLVLLSRDRRAMGVYDRLGVQVTLVS